MYMHVMDVIWQLALCDGSGGLFSRAVVHILNTCMNCNFMNCNTHTHTRGNV